MDQLPNAREKLRNKSNTAAKIGFQDIIFCFKSPSFRGKAQPENKKKAAYLASSDSCLKFSTNLVPHETVEVLRPELVSISFYQSISILKYGYFFLAPLL